MSVRVTQTALLISTPRTSKVRVTQVALLISAQIPLVISYPLSPPAISGIGPQNIILRQINLVGEIEGEFDLQQQIQNWNAQAWQLEADLPPMLYPQAEQWLSFLGSLFGKFGTFLMGDYNRPTPQGPMSGSPVASSALASAQSISLTGCTPSITNWAVAGDYIQFTPSGAPQRLHKVLQNANSDGSGNISLDIFPNLRENVPGGTSIITTNCRGTFRLMANTFEWKIDKNKKYVISFKAKEAF